MGSGCKKADKAPGTESSGSAGSGGSVAKDPPAATPPAGSATPPPASTPPAAGGGTGVVPSGTLEAIKLPPPKGAPANGMWSSATAGGDGDRATNYMVGEDLWVSLRFLDCNLPMVKEAASKPPTERGDFAFCYDAANGKLKDFPMYSPADSVRVVKAGHLVIITGIGVAAEGKLKAADLEDFLGSLDLAALAKL
jgi:hypothetical protein